jgi:hypothetical protein
VTYSYAGSPYSLAVSSILSVQNDWSPTLVTLSPPVRMLAATREAIFVTAAIPCVTKAGAYWFGSSAFLSSSLLSERTDASQYSGTNAAISISWQNRLRPAGGRDVYSIFVYWGQGSDSGLEWVITSFSKTMASGGFWVQGTIKHEAGSEIMSVSSVLDGDWSKNQPAASSAPRSSKAPPL